MNNDEIETFEGNKTWFKINPIMEHLNRKHLLIIPSVVGQTILYYIHQISSETDYTQQTFNI
jgi:hypothetical protein